MLSTAHTVYKQSGGALDLSIYPVIQRWGFDSGHYYVPTDEELWIDLSHKGYDQMVLTSFPSSGSYAVAFPAGTQISFGAVNPAKAMLAVYSDNLSLPISLFR